MNINRKIEQAEEGMEYWLEQLKEAEANLEEFEDDLKYYKEQKRKGVRSVS
jgi:chromosome segregation ATPase